MKNNILWLLVKTKINNTYKLSSLTTKKKLLFGFLFIYIFFSLIITFNSFLVTIFDTLKKVNLVNYYMPVVLVVSSLFVLVFTIFTAKNSLFDNKDNDLLLSLPIEKSTILASRLIILFIFDIIISLLFIIPGLRIYLMNVTVDLNFYIAIISSMIFITAIPTVIACLFGYLVAFITSKARNKNIVELLCYIIFVAVYLVLVMKGNSILTILANNPDLFMKILKIVFSPIYFISKSITEGNILYTLLFIIINVVVMLAFIYLLGNSYYKIISSLSSTKTKSNFHMKNKASLSSKKALRNLELKKYFSSAIYVFNTLFGIVFLIIASIGSMFYTSDEIIKLIGEDISLTPFGFVMFATIFCIGFTITTNCAISIERSNFWILKMLPINIKDIFDAKTYVNKIIVVPAAIVCMILFKISGYINYTELLLLIVICILYNSFISNIGLIINLIFPKLDAPNDTVVVKQSVASLVGILAPMALAFIVVLPILSLNLDYISISLILIFISLILIFVTRYILNTWGVNKFKEIN